MVVGLAERNCVCGGCDASGDVAVALMLRIEKVRFGKFNVDRLCNVEVG